MYIDGPGDSSASTVGAEETPESSFSMSQELHSIPVMGSSARRQCLLSSPNLSPVRVRGRIFISRGSGCVR